MDTKDSLPSGDLDQKISSLSNDIHSSLSLHDTNENNGLDNSKTDNEIPKQVSARMKVTDIFTKMLQRKRETEKIAKPFESGTVSSENLPENTTNSLSSKNIHIQPTKKSAFVKKMPDYSKTFEVNNPKGDNLTMKEVVNHKEAEINLKSETSKQTEPRLRKKKNEVTHRIQSRDNSQSPKITQSNRLIKTPITKSQEETAYETRRVRSAGSERKSPTISRFQKSANSSPARNRSCDPESASAIRKAVFDDWCQKKMEEKKKKLKEHQQREKAYLEKKQKEETDKKYESEQTFLSWKKRKDELLKKQSHVKKLDEDKYKTEEVEKNKDAELGMQPLKQIKDDKIIIKKKEIKKLENYKTVTDKEDREKEKHEAKLAFEAWKAQKDAELRKRILVKKKLAEEELRKQNEKTQKELEAIKAYEEWLEQKDKLYRQAKKDQQLLKQSPSQHADWCPTGKSYLNYVRQKRCVT